MSESLIRLTGVGKMYKIFPSRGANLMDALGVSGFLETLALPRERARSYREFWALRGIDLDLQAGQRLGIIGRNGAGKTTLLKLITQNLTPTEGNVEIRGQVQALLEMGGGLHPEFTGKENIQAALTFLGLSPSEIREADEDIAEFTELGRFLEQPFKTYSLGMQARLAFAIATAIKPEILIVDEVLGAGDAYFFGKSTARMQNLIEGGASVLLVSHALDQIVRFCDDAIWIDRGRIVLAGPSTEVVKGYEKFIRELEDRRLKAKNKKLREHKYDGFERESYTDYLTVRVTAEGAGAHCDVSELRLLRGGSPEDQVGVGDAQDADATQSSHVVLEPGDWSPPAQDEYEFFRGLRPSGPGGPAAVASGDGVFHLWFFYADSRYSIEVRYRLRGGTGRVEVGRNGRLDSSAELPASDEWTTVRLALVDRTHSASGTSRTLEDASHGKLEPAESSVLGRVHRSDLVDRPDPLAISDDEEAARVAVGERQEHKVQTLSRWPGEGSLVIEDLVLSGEGGEERAVFRAGEPMTMSVSVRARRSGRFEVIPAAVLFRLDGILVSNHPGELLEVELGRGELRELRLEFGPLNLGDGRYVFSVALYRKLSHLEPSEHYDLIDRSYEFEIVGNDVFNNGIFRHPALWSLTPPSTRPAIAEGATSTR